ncbi:MAG TPA: porin [Kofleriaceae bacterium]|jgi:phosphate-selective porin OprO/OprP|nr:porin [Kofleriaceae bacterium]
MKPLLAILWSALLGSSAHAQPTTPGTPPSDAGAASPDPGAPAPAPDAPPTPDAPVASQPPSPPPVLDAAAIEKLIDARVDERLAKQPRAAGGKDGFFVQTSDGGSRIQIGGILQFDGRWFIDDADDPHVDQFAFRSIRPDLQGTLFEHYDFRLLPDFAGARLVLQEAYVDLRYGDAVKFRFGKFKVPFGLERLQSEANTAFIERGLPTQIAPNRDLGVQVFGELARGIVAYQVGVFNGVADGQSGDGDVSDDKELAARVFVKPFATGGRLVKELGIGAAATYGDKLGTLASPDVASFRTQGQTTFFSYKVGTTLMDTVIADGPHWRVTGQGHYYAGPLGVLAEYIRSRQKIAIDGTHQWVAVDAWQILGQWVITGGDASYKGVAPRRPFDPHRGQWGAFDIAARIGELRLSGAEIYPHGYADPTKSAHRAWSAGGGADWFLNKNLRFVLDFEHTWYDRGAKDGGDKPAESSLVGRLQITF